MSIRVIIADDEKMFRKLLCIYLKNSEKIEVVGEAQNGEALLQLMEKVETDVVLLDLNMPKISGLEALVEIKKKHKSVKVVILSCHDADNYIVQCTEGGAAGYLHKNADTEEIEVAVESVYNDKFYFNEQTNRAFLARITKRKNLTPIFDINQLSLNPTELGVLKYICQEFTSSEIAKKVYVTPRAVEAVRQKLIKKVNAKNTVGLALFAVRNGFDV